MSDYLKGKRVVDPVLTSIARGYKNAAFIGERIFPVVLTDKEGVRVPTFGKTAFVEYDTERAVGADSNVLVREKTGTLDLVLGEHDLAAPVDYREQAESMFNEESKAIRRATNGVNLRRELIAARLAQDEKVYRTGHVKKLTASDRWVGGKGDPIGVIEAGMEAVRTATGLRPNLMTMGAGVMALLKFHPAIQAAIGANERKRITTEILQDLFAYPLLIEVRIVACIPLSDIATTGSLNVVPSGILKLPSRRSVMESSLLNPMPTIPEVPVVSWL